MRLTTTTQFDVSKVVDVAEAVDLVLERAAPVPRFEALKGIVVRMLNELIDNRVLRPEQVSMIFDYDVIAEDD